jgi:hypothetical protein
MSDDIRLDVLRDAKAAAAKGNLQQRIAAIEAFLGIA